MALDFDILEVAKNVVKQEAMAIEQLSTYMDEEFKKFVELIFTSKGRVIITGIGKIGRASCRERVSLRV